MTGRRSSILPVACIVGATAFWSFPARATLTDSEKAQVAGFVSEGVPSKAARTRALVARPDLNPREVSEPLIQGYESAPFDQRRLRFTEALLFGPGSAPARNTLAPAVVEALLARAAHRLQQVPAAPAAPWSSRARAAADEVLAIYRFIDERIANAGRPPEEGHDAAAGIRDDALRASAEHVRQHLVQHAEWWHGKTAPSADVRRLYLQCALALIDLSRGVVERFTVADWLGLDGAERAAFERHGVLFSTEGGSPERRNAVLALVERAPRALSSVSLFLVSKLPTAGLTGRGVRVSAGTRLDPDPPRADASHFWAEDVSGSEPDAQLAQVALAVSRLAARRALESNPALRDVATAAVGRAEAAGAEGYLAVDLVNSALAPRATQLSGLRGLAPELLVAHAARLLLVDAPRALDLALIRAAGGRPEPLEQVVLGLSAIASPGADSMVLSRVAQNGALEPVEVTQVTRDDALISGFTLLDHRYEIKRGAKGEVVAMLDGQPPAVHKLPSFRLRLRRVQSWTAPGGERIERLFGEPAGADAGDGRFVLSGSAGGFDAVALGSDGARVSVRSRLVPSGPGGGPMIGAAGETSYRGVALLVSGQPREARLVAVDGTGRAWQLGAAAKLRDPKKDGYLVELSLAEGRVTGRVDGVRLKADAPEYLKTGRGGFTARAGGRIELRGISVTSGSVK